MSDLPGESAHKEGVSPAEHLKESQEESAISAASVLPGASGWDIAKTILGWEGLSFIVVFPFAVGFVAMEKFLAARIFFVFSAVALAAKLVSSSAKYLPEEWVGRGKFGGFILAAFFLSGMLYWVSTEETKAKRKLDDNKTANQLQATQFAAAMGDPVRDIVIVLTFKQDYNSESISPIDAGFEFLGFDRANDAQAVYLAVHYDASIQDHVVMGQKSSYFRIRWAYTKEDKPSEYGMIVAPKAVIPKISIPFSFKPKKDGAFVSLRDFNGALFHPWLSKVLLDKTAKIELLVNGWIVMEADPASAYWKSEKAEWSVFDAPMELETPWSSDFHGDKPPRGLWWLDFLDSVPKYEKTRPPAALYN
jgi:hypothetical protein